MLLLGSAFFLTLLQCSNAQNKTSITPVDCNTIETDAGGALDLVNRHRRDGYVFGLYRVADAQAWQTGNSSVLYLTLDVLETECSVLSRRHWESCEYSDTYFMDFGQCKIITYTSQLLKKPQLYGFNCTLSPVPPDLLECKDCPVKVEVLEVTEQHKNIAAKALEKFNSEGNHTNYFNVDKVEKILKMTASREGHILGFSIKETNCSKSAQQADQALECDFLDDWHAHVGFCKARVISDPDEPDGIDISCEIYRPWQHDNGQRCRYSTPGQPRRYPHPHPHHHFGHRHHHRHGCLPSSQSRPEDPEHNHSFNKEHQDSHEVPAPPPPHGGPNHHVHPPHHCPPPPSHGGPHHHPPPPPHDVPHPPPQEEPQHPPSVPPPHDAPHPLLQEEPYHPPSAPPPHDDPHPLLQEEPYHPPTALPPHDDPHDPRLGPHHGPHRPPPPHGPHHPHRPPHHRPHCPLPPHGPHHPHPPPHHRPHCPLPPHGPHHPHLPLRHGPPCPLPPHGPHHPHPPPHCGPHSPPPPGHPPHLYHHRYRHHCNKTSILGKYFPFQITGAVYRIPVLNQQDSLTPPTANFPELSQSNPHSSSTGEGIPFTGSSLKEMREAPGFPDHPTQSKSCPGNPKLVLPKILPLFPHSFHKAENSLT